MEKDLCLDVALRLGKIIQQRLPSAEVVFTRDDDTFIPLERRTEIANEAKADLFISVHANSSQDHKARGIETYYLNFTGSSDAMEVASRENALSENAVHDLQDIVKKIARNEKIEESRDLATMIQDSLPSAWRTSTGRAQPRRAQGSLRRVDRRGYALGAGRDFVSFQSQRRAMAEETRKPPERRRRAVPRNRELSAKHQQPCQESSPLRRGESFRESGAIRELAVNFQRLIYRATCPDSS